MVSECFLNDNFYFEWYFGSPLRVPLSPAEISLILNGIQW